MYMYIYIYTYNTIIIAGVVKAGWMHLMHARLWLHQGHDDADDALTRLNLSMWEPRGVHAQNKTQTK